MISSGSIREDDGWHELVLSHDSRKRERYISYLIGEDADI